MSTALNETSIIFISKMEGADKNAFFRCRCIGGNVSLVNQYFSQYEEYEKKGRDGCILGGYG